MCEFPKSSRRLVGVQALVALFVPQLGHAMLVGLLPNILAIPMDLHPLRMENLELLQPPRERFPASVGVELAFQALDLEPLERKRLSFVA